MMAQPVKTRSQRRIERKQLTLVIILILTLVGISFSLGVMFGKRSLRPALVDDAETTSLSNVTQIAPPPQPAAAETETKPEKLTFYDNLPKGKQAPLGSGINLPPKVEVEPPAKPPPAVQRNPPEPPRPVTKKAPEASSQGAFVVQVASFRTRADADKLVARLKAYDLTPFLEQAQLGDKGTWYRVLSGPYQTREHAERAVELLREKERLSALVRQR